MHLIPLLLGWLLDLCLGDPAWLPHPIVWFGKAISACERRWNRGSHRKLKGGLVAVGLILAVFLLSWLIMVPFPAAFKGTETENVFWKLYSSPLGEVGRGLLSILTVFFCLAGTTLIREVHAVFLALDRSLDEGRRQVGRIVGRDTIELSAQEVRTAALETLAENLSDGVVAPLFWFALL